MNPPRISIDRPNHTLRVKDFEPHDLLVLESHPTQLVMVAMSPYRPYGNVLVCLTDPTLSWTRDQAQYRVAHYMGKLVVQV